MNDKRLEQFALDWNRIVEGWQRTLEQEMDAAYAAGDGRTYLLAGRLRGEMKAAREVMLGVVAMHGMSDSTKATADAAGDAAAAISRMTTAVQSVGGEP